MREPVAVLSAMCAEALPDSVARTLTGLGMAANDLGLALAEARLQQIRAAMQLHRASDLEDVLGELPAEYDPVGQWHEAARGHCEQLVAIYAQLAGTYAAYAVEVFSALQNRRSLTELAVPQVVPSDLLTMPQILLPLVQLKATADGRTDPARHNRDLAASHQAVTDATSTLGRDEPPSILDDANRLAQRDLANDLTDDLPQALHDYAATVVFALAELIPDS